MGTLRKLNDRIQVNDQRYGLVHGEIVCVAACTSDSEDIAYLIKLFDCPGGFDFNPGMYEIWKKNHERDKITAVFDKNSINEKHTYTWMREENFLTEEQILRVVFRNMKKEIGLT